MKIKKMALVLSTVVITLVLSGCDWFSKSSTRETIFDKVVSIPKELVLNIPNLPPLCDELPGIKKGFVDILDGKLYYEEEGQGIPLVLINGGPGCTHHGFHPYFSQIKDIAHIIYYDQRGTGKSSWDDTGKTYTIKQAVEDLESLRKALKIDRWAVLGWSNGGFLAQCYALTYPNCFIGLILISSNSGLYAPINRKQEHMVISQAEWDAIENIGGNQGPLTSDAQVVYNKNISGDWKRYRYYKPTKEELIRTSLYEWNSAPGFETLMRSEISQTNLKGKFDDFEIPTLIIEGKWDLAWQCTNRAELMRKNHPHAQLEIFEKSGHKVFADEPEKFFSVLKDFLEKSSKANIVYKPGNRLTWPKPHSDLELKTIMTQSLQDNGTSR
jgi:proline iminopeptidase